MSVAAALALLGGVARTGTLKERGITARQLASALADGKIVQVRRGVYAIPEAPDLVKHAAFHGGVPACTDAGAAMGLWILRSSGHCVWLGRAGQPGDGCQDCRIHWDRGTAVFGRLPPVQNVLLQIATCEDEETFFAAYESALRWSKISPGGIAWLWSRVPESLRRLMGIARSDADSGLESIVRLRLHRLGITVRTQVGIPGVGEVDIMIGDRLLIHCDGRENHEGEARRHRDLWRDAAAAALGYETLRFDYAMIVHDWPRVEAAILAKIAEGAHLRTPA
ncbi:type IV toxin-antitoxin system AbiEi family antitoxin domain-containing protein [Microbacterium sp.]|uniref:type IV toxin-antitoxin system AbiEi family antitoxin domain-containing protein n=1 Tax=Microbacterium sp. TaxID=51671 RepID=UPI002811469F|nr:type IV toxin-antitoxin system AbiEi family antitoxin domain-containing protein [Microbacterium sp.]